MIISNQDAEYLLQLPKKIVERKFIRNEVTIGHNFPFTGRFKLVSEQDDDWAFLWEFQQSRKNTIRVSFHCQEDDGKTGLLRVDYNSGHKNPETINEFVPEKFHRHAGKHFSKDEHHIHYHVQGYRSLAWALPLDEDGFEIKELGRNSEFNGNLEKNVLSFARRINIETHIRFQTNLIGPQL